MAVPKLTLAILGLGGVAFLATRKKKKASPTTTTRRTVVLTGVPPVSEVDLSQIDHPICKKYPGGQWHPESGYVDGYPKDSPGWNDADVKMVQDAVSAAVATAPQWESVDEARQITFDLTRSIIHRWCPSMALPTSRITLENHLKKSLGLRWMWDRLDNMLWNKLTTAGF